ncbi:ABC transporter ATP-binding protein [Dehalogenimonas etheniformans]|uniref:ABC transporter ATP-binding protein n=1 Tax=Dehalogenimonas etheniformans TaxID=1536648 RepID=A0A2P5P8G9_9CHLR|nr:ABC transporter ATP-binding protein [Dehalogenimonas etheniformans]PPD58575.1 ABC transporter ATP-binding protein [Dehalogenimonas etheniformans]QNT76661.1 ABC transporter ATP-binding protein [Dehalogenimonas etheniformans]
MPVLEANGLIKRYGQTDIIKGISLSVEAGETIAFIGPSGAGKSTLLRLLDLLELPSGGTIALQGTRVGRKNSERLEFRRRMSFVHQKPLVFSSSVFDNVAQPLKWRGFKKEDLHERVGKALALVGMEHYSSRAAKTLSGGETQRIAIARSLVTDPEILFLDEPTANLDPPSTARVEELITKIIKTQNLTVVMATHDLAQGQRLAGRIGVLMNGELMQLAKSDEIFLAPACRAVAEFIGIENIFSGTVIGNLEGMVNVDVSGQVFQTLGDFAIGDKVNLFVRPEDVTVSLAAGSTSARNCLRGTISRLSLINPLVRLEIDCGFKLMAVITRASSEEMGLSLGSNVYACLKATAIHAVRA